MSSNKKLEVLAEDWGYETTEALLIDATFNSTSPGICMTENCSYTTEVEPDQGRGYCEHCGTKTVQSALWIAGII